MSTEPTKLPENSKDIALWLDECYAKHYAGMDIESMDGIDASGALDLLLQGTMLRRLIARLKETGWLYQFHTNLSEDGEMGIGYTASYAPDIDKGLEWLRAELQTPDEAKDALSRYKRAVREASAALSKVEGAV